MPLFSPELTEEGLRQEQVQAAAMLTHTCAAVLEGDSLARLGVKRARIVCRRGGKTWTAQGCAGAVGLENEQVFQKLKESSACQRADSPR